LGVVAVEPEVRMKGVDKELKILQGVEIGLRDDGVVVWRSGDSGIRRMMLPRIEEGPSPGEPEEEERE
jgi:hypothetical protein